MSIPDSLRAAALGVSIFVIGLIVVLALPSSSRWESTAIVAADSFEINRTRIPRTAAALVRETSREYGENATVLPIEESGLVSVTYTATSAEQAEKGLQLLLGGVVTSLNRAGPDVGNFVQVTDTVTRKTSTGTGSTSAILFWTVGMGSISLSASGAYALLRREASPTADGGR